MDIVSSLEKIITKEYINSKIAQKESKDTIVDLAMENRIEKSNHIEESYAKAMQDMDIYHGDLSVMRMKS